MSLPQMKGLQTDEPIIPWEQWLSELVGYYADASKIDKIAAMRYVNTNEAREWYDDGFTPYVTFRETYNQ